MVVEPFAQLLTQVFTVGVTAGAVYGALRADLRSMRAEVGRALEDARQAHQRIDRVLERDR